MRLWPVAATGSSRVAEADIETGPYLIPKGAALIFPLLPIHRSVSLAPSSSLPHPPFHPLPPPLPSILHL